MLNTGPGPGPLLAAAATWADLSTEYGMAATELTAVLADAHSIWEGPTGEAYALAHLHYLAWLQLASVLSARTATQHEVIAGAYSTALAAMPTAAELAANHAIHAVLVATNFFGINTIPIAANEADYVRMWIQAASTMSTYEAATEAAETLGHSSGGRQVGAAAASGGNGSGGNGSFQLPTPAEIWQMLFAPDGTQIPGQGQPTWTPAEFLQNLSNVFTGNGKAVSWLEQNLHGLLDPSQFPALLSYFVAWQTFRAVNWTLRSLRFLAQLAPLLLPVGLNLAIADLGGLAGLAGLAGIQPSAAPAPPAPADAQPETWTTPAVAPVVAAPLPPGAPTAVPAAAPPTVPVAQPVPVTGAESYFYLIGGPGPTAGPRLGTRARAEEPAAECAAAATTATAPTRQEAGAHRHRRAVIDRGHRYEFLRSESVPADRGAGPLGFTGTAGKVGADAAAGLTALADDGFGGGPSVPMVPDTWAGN